MLTTLLKQTPFQAYSYAYPHKSAYRPLKPPQALHEVWATENRNALFLYIHIPFCEMRCGFCNLLTLARPTNDFYPRYLDALKRQSEQVSEFLGEYSFARLAIGGGTPTFLDESALATVLDIAQKTLGAENIPSSVEVSPETATVSKLSLLAERSIDRISIGIQSFIDAENRTIRRRQNIKTVTQALENIRHNGFPTLNIDLIYGIEGQSLDSWLYSLREVLRFQPEEIYLYPLYVRPLTGLDGQRFSSDIRMQLYRLGREFLLENNYHQISMRLFRAAHAPANEKAPIYCCQEDGMLGLGSGARSYTRALHYSSEYAVSRRNVKDIIMDYCQRTFKMAYYGIELDENEQKRRYFIKSILQIEGLNLEAYRCQFGTEVLGDFPELAELLRLGLCEYYHEQKLIPTVEGLAYSDIIGPWLISQSVKQRMESFNLQ
ncbi:coproporphyrinogen III oxidase [Candidatus Thiomargarita nelsonii]|uniref:Coproporphyrinogen III oxidase n=1 Tax=Candidatus Thiomargarita nelsonii TaxID=1003181 RepID=A0A0A6PB63_9GAMM|nr:coproporphyrinogen III oxidase [Candidatus Thiomargarita nelsonii]